MFDPYLIHVLLVSASLAIHWQPPTGNITCTYIMLTSDVCIVYLLGNTIATTTTSVSISLFFTYKIVSMCTEQWHCEQERMCVWSLALRQQRPKKTHIRYTGLSLRLIFDETVIQPMPSTWVVLISWYFKQRWLQWFTVDISNTHYMKPRQMCIHWVFVNTHEVSCTQGRFGNLFVWDVVFIILVVKQIAECHYMSPPTVYNVLLFQTLLLSYNVKWWCYVFCSFYDLLIILLSLLTDSTT